MLAEGPVSLRQLLKEVLYACTLVQLCPGRLVAQVCALPGEHTAMCAWDIVVCWACVNLEREDRAWWWR